MRVFEDILQQITRDEIARCLALDDAVFDGLLRSVPQRLVGLQNLRHIFADLQFSQVLQVGQAVEHEDALHELVGVFHERSTDCARLTTDTDS